jgi:hypothetical protein
MGLQIRDDRQMKALTGLSGYIVAGAKLSISKLVP